MHPNAKHLLAEHNLTRYAALLEESLKPAVRFSVSPMTSDPPVGASRVGGRPDLPPGFQWPENKGRPLDFLLQVNLADLVGYHHPEMPTVGVVTFFYDLENQPWGFDPDNLHGFRVHYHPNADGLVRVEALPHVEYALPESKMTFREVETLPHCGSLACEELLGQMPLEDDEDDTYFEFVEAYDRLYSDSFTSHQFFGHSSNIQNDMQLEAQLVTNGIYCGDGSGFDDPRIDALAEDAGQWQLLLQLDSDDRVHMWGDNGMLYFWIRGEDLRAAVFDRVWMTLQCY